MWKHNSSVFVTWQNGGENSQVVFPHIETTHRPVSPPNRQNNHLKRSGEALAWDSAGDGKITGKNCSMLQLQTMAMHDNSYFCEAPDLKFHWYCIRKFNITHCLTCVHSLILHHGQTAFNFFCLCHKTYSKTTKYSCKIQHFTWTKTTFFVCLILWAPWRKINLF